MASAEKPIIAVVGATGAQGGSVVRFLLADPDRSIRVRALTRKVDSSNAQALASLGVEVVFADIDKPESLVRAFEGAHGVFGVTNFWETMSEETEIRQGKALVDAAIAAGVKHYVWSSLEHTTNPRVGHADTKAVIDDYLRTTSLPRTSLFTVFYMENLLYLPFFSLSKVDGKVVADWPLMWTDGQIYGYSVTETGAYVLEAFKNPKKWIDNDILVVPSVFTPRDFVNAVKEVTGKEFEFRETDRKRFDDAKSTNEELWNNMEWFYRHDGKWGHEEGLAKSSSVIPNRKDIRAWVAANKDAFMSLFDS